MEVDSLVKDGDDDWWQHLGGVGSPMHRGERQSFDSATAHLFGCGVHVSVSSVAMRVCI